MNASSRRFHHPHGAGTNGPGRGLAFGLFAPRQRQTGRAVELRTPIEAPTGPSPSHASQVASPTSSISRAKVRTGAQAKRPNGARSKAGRFPSTHSHSAELTITWLVFFSRTRSRRPFKEQPQDRQRELQQEFDDIPRGAKCGRRSRFASRRARSAPVPSTSWTTLSSGNCPRARARHIGTALDDVFAFAGQSADGPG